MLLVGDREGAKAMDGRNMGWRTLTAGLVVWLGVAAHTSGQFATTPTPNEEGLRPAVMIVPPGRETLQALHQAGEALKQGRTGDGIQLLQRLIELPEDYFTDRSMRLTLKSETLRILAGLSSAERDAYELLRGKVATGLLSDAKSDSDAELLADIVRRFPMTAASVEAAEILAVSALDQGRPFQAAAQLAQLRKSPIVSQVQLGQLTVREALAWQAAGQPERAAALLWEFTSQGTPNRVQVGDQPLPKFADEQQAARWLAQLSPVTVRTESPAAKNWVSPRGSATGVALFDSAGPIGGPAWHADVMELAAADLRPREGVTAAARLDDELTRAEAPLRDDERPLWTTTSPLVIDDAIVFRTVRDIVALDRKTGAVRWRSVLSDPDFDPVWAAEPTRQEIRGGLSSSAAVGEYLRERLYDDRTFGSLSSDGRLVYALEGLGFYSQTAVNNGQRMLNLGDDSLWYGSNRLTAYDLAGGRLAWEIGGERDAAAGEFAGHFFLGPPTPCDGQLFVLAEVQGELRLLVLQADEQGVQKIWSQPLAAPIAKITEQEVRRRQGLMPACADGVIICPTSSGVTIAVDLMQRRLLWAYQYQSTETGLANGNDPFGGVMVRPVPAYTDTADNGDTGWLDGTPVVANGRVFLTPLDSDELHCVQLSDGKPLWKIPRSGATYLAGADAERVLLIGPGRVEAIQVVNGASVWEEPLRVPEITGRGVWLADRYLLPLATGEIASVDLITGRILARSKLPDGRLPGHLAAGSGGLVSLSPRAAMSFRGRAETETFLAERLAANPQDAAALGLRGEQRLHLGERDPGLADLRASVANGGNAYVKSVLAAALLAGLRYDFAGNRDAVAELESLTDDPQQRYEFLWLVARRLKDAGEHRAAFDRMLPLVDQPLDDIAADGVGSPWLARTDRRLAGHFAALYRAATAEERTGLDELITARLPSNATAAQDELIAANRRFLRVFGFHPLAITARRQLAALLDPELHAVEYAWLLAELAEQSDLTIAAPAVGTLARWSAQRKRYDDVTAWLAVLEGRCAEAECEPGVTGRQLAALLREDAAYIAHMKEFPAWPTGRIDQQRTNQPNNNGRMIRATIIGRVPEHYQGWSFETDPQGTMLVARDAQASYRWRLTRPAGGGPAQQFFGEVPVGLHRVHLFDHLVGWSAGTEFIIAADLEAEHATPKTLWQESLLPAGTDASDLAGQINFQRARPLFARRRLMMNSMPMATGGAGELIAITRSAVIYQNGRKLCAADPLTGQLLWSRGDFPAGNLTLSAADDQLVTQLETQSGTMLSPPLRRFRAVDGEMLPTVSSLPGALEYIGGSRVVRYNPTRTAESPKSLELYDLAAGKPVWQADLAQPAVIRIWNQTEIYTFEENRRLTVRNLADGAIRWTRDVEVTVPIEVLYVQHWKDRVLAVLGTLKPAPATPGSARAVGFDANHIPLAGYVLSAARDTGEIHWQTAINELPTDPTAFDAWQPPGWPVLVFAGKLFPVPAPGIAAPIIPRITATLIDKETGRVVYGVEEPSNIGTYFVEADPERNRLTANFLTFAVELHYTGKPVK